MWVGGGGLPVLGSTLIPSKLSSRFLEPAGVPSPRSDFSRSLLLTKSLGVTHKGGGGGEFDFGARGVHIFTN